MSVPKLRFRREDGASYPDLGSIKLGERFTFKNGINASREAFRSGGIRCIGVSDVVKCLPIIAEEINGRVAISESEIKKNKVNYGDILFQRSSETKEDIGHASVYYDEAPSVYNGFVICAKPDTLFYEPLYLHYSLQHSRVRKQTIMLGAGTGQHYNIGQDGLSQINIALPCLEEQKKIADMLLAVEEAIKYTEAEILNLERQKKGAMQKLFSQAIRFKRDNGSNYPEWREKRIGDICNIFSGGTPSTTISEYWENGTIVWIPSGCIQNCILTDSKIGKMISESGLKHSSAKMIKANTTLLAMTGATCGKTAFLTFPACANQSVMAFETEIESSKFIFYLFQKNYDYITSYKAGGAQSGINKDSCSNLMFDFPCLEEQQKIADSLSAYDEAIGYARQELEKWKELKRGLLQQMFV